MNSDATRPWRTFAASAAVAGIGLALLLPGGADALVQIAASLPISIGLPALWFLAAAGLGVMIHRAGIGPRGDGVTAWALGTALLLCITNALARSGVLAAGNGLCAWLLLAGCIIPGAILLPRSGVIVRSASGPPARERSPLDLIAPAAAALGFVTLLLAAHAAAGWLWRSEFGGYDVLSYHLQLPAEWLAAADHGRAARGLEHNVYSFLPSFMETAFMHLMLLSGDAVSAVIPAQLLHAGTMLLAAACVGRLARRLPGAPTGWVPAALLLGTPWVIVTGSMAYNEGVLLLAISAGMVVITDPSARAEGKDRAGREMPADPPSDQPAWLSTWIPLGLLTAAACGAKPTAAFLVGLPLAAALLLLHPMTIPAFVRCVLVGMIAALLPLLPWLIQNAGVSGNPVFPYLTKLFGSGHWNAEQIARWHEGHRAAPNPLHLLHRFLRQGIGPEPASPGGPWLAQWSILPLLAIAGVITALVRSGLRDARRRLPAILALMVIIQCTGWLLLTHQQARFLLPAAPLLALLATALLPSPRRDDDDAHTTSDPRSASRPAARLHAWTAGAALAIFALGPVLLLRGEGGGRPLQSVGGEAWMDGSATADLLQRATSLTPDERSMVARNGGAAYWINNMLPADARTLSVGWATPLYIGANRLTYHTVWDRGPWSRAVEAHGEDAAAVRDDLAAQGYTHLLIDLIMLSIWQESGWSDPATAPDLVRRIAEDSMHPVIDDGRGVVLFRLRAGDP